MKTMMMFFIFLLLPQLVSAQRIGQAEREKLLVEIREGLLEYKQEFGVNLDLLKMKPDVMEFAWELHYEDQLATQAEILQFQRDFDVLAAKRDLDNTQKEAAIMQLFGDLVDRINASPLQCVEEGKSCNDWLCCDGLMCANIPDRLLPKPNLRCVEAQKPCEKNADCCTGLCEENLLTRTKSCQQQKRCYRPVKLGQSCEENPVCAEGSCDQYNENTLGIGECTSRGQSCDKNSDCCTGKCSSGKCVRNYMCKDCVPQGEVPSRGRKCCEGLMPDRETKQCIIDLPAFFGSIQKPSLWVSFVLSVSSVIIPSAHAQDSGSNFLTRLTETRTEFQNETNDIQGESAVQAVRDAIDSGAISDIDLMRMQNSDLNFEDPNAPLSNENKATADSINRSGGSRFTFQRGSNFETCEINFRNDYLIALAETRKGFNTSLYDLQIALMGFEYMALGAGTQDLLKVGHKNLHSSLKEIAVKSRDQRRQAFDNVVNKHEDNLRCLCYDKNGYDNLTAEQKQFFESTCPAQYAEYLALKAEAEASGQGVAGLTDASGIKYQEMIVAWYEATAEFEHELFIAHTNLSSEMAEISEWAKRNKWNEAETRKYKLFNFTIRNYSGKVMFGTAVASALLSAGVIAITGGFAASATLSAWAAAGIISTAAVTGSLGVWLVGSLKGAWQSQAPYISDEYVKGRENYKCGKKDRCSDFTRVLNQPFNRVCNRHVPANGCIRSFLVTEVDGDTRFLIDPWVPLGVPTNKVIRDNRVYADLLEAGFAQGRRYLSGNNPADIVEVRDDLECNVEMVYNPISRQEEEKEVCKVNTVRNVIHPSGFRPASYLQQTFVDEVAVSQFLPRLRTSEDLYTLTPEIERLVKEGARKYVVDEGFFLESETENLETFANYAWRYHFLFPRLSKDDGIAYPTPGLVTYLTMVGEALDQASRQNDAGREGMTNVDGTGILDLARLNLSQTRQGFTRANRLGTQGRDQEGQQLNQGNLGLNTDDNLAGSSLVGASNNVMAAGSRFTDGNANLSNDSVTGITRDNLSFGNLAGVNAEKLNSAIALRKRMDEKKKKDQEYWMETVGDTERGRNILEAQKELFGAFVTPTQYGQDGQGVSASSLAGSDLRNTTNEARGALAGANRGAIVTSLPSSNIGNQVFGGGSSSSGSAVGNRSGQGLSGFNAGDADRMREAIAARDRMNSESFQTKEGDSLWQIVTNTYIRMYDRLLPRRQDLRDLEE
jgi:hypothetical protein